MKKEWVKNDRSLEEFKTAVKTPGNTGDLDNDLSLLKYVLVIVYIL